MQKIYRAQDFLKECEVGIKAPCGDYQVKVKIFVSHWKLLSPFDVPYTRQAR
jgi:hypothetical protein